MPFPKISHIQTSVLSVIGERNMTGDTLRTGLKEIGAESDGPKFYMLIHRMIKEGSIESSLTHTNRRAGASYKVTKKGKHARKVALEYYELLKAII